MKYILLTLSLCLNLIAADIDTKLYEGNNTITYHQEISKNIDLEPSNTQEDKERITAERNILGKLGSLLAFEPKTNAFPKKLLPDDQNISMENYFSFLNALTDIYTTLDTLKEEKEVMLAKLEYLKETIANTTADNKQNLLLNQLEYAF